MMLSHLAPGFRFRPTDAELVMYHLKRKVLKKKFRNVIAEVNIYKFSPWDLPVKSFLKTKDLEWYFFCPKEMKYASGSRVKRDTEEGYWKTTGKDRPVWNEGIVVGNIRTLVFHRGNAPNGERTDWVIHEYGILDNQLPAAAVQDKYVLCKVFKKAGRGPMNGADYGAPFVEEEWPDDDDDDSQSHAVPTTSDVPPPTVLLQPSGLPLTNAGPAPSADNPVSEVVGNEPDDEVPQLLAMFTDDDRIIDQAIFRDLGDLPGWTGINCGKHVNISGLQKDSYLLGNMLVPDDQSYIEMNDFMLPLNCSTGPAIGPPDQAAVNEKVETNHDDITNMHAGASCSYQQPAFLDESYEGQGNAPLNMINNQFHEGSDSAFNLGSTQRELVHGVKFKGMKRGTHRKIHSSRLLDSIPARTPLAAVHLTHFSNGSSMHIKAEVTHGAGECTNETLLFMMEGSSSCGCHLPVAVSQEVLLWFWDQLLYFDFHLLIVYCYFNQIKQCHLPLAVSQEVLLWFWDQPLYLGDFHLLIVYCYFNHIKQYCYQDVCVHCDFPSLQFMRKFCLLLKCASYFNALIVLLYCNCP